MTQNMDAGRRCLAPSAADTLASAAAQAELLVIGAIWVAVANIVVIGAVLIAADRKKSAAQVAHWSKGACLLLHFTWLLHFI
jgi:hypothetical protein